jgi:mRNA interferase RelE/StbE
MQVSFDRSFSKALGKIKDKTVLNRIEKAILNCEHASTLKEIKNLKKLTGFKAYYRIKIGEYRIGIEYEKPKQLHFITVLHRKNIYNRFP